MPKLPKFQKGNQSIDDISNPLFFGAFAEFEEHKYLDYVSEDIVCNYSARPFQAKDIYQGGIVFSDKFRKLSHAYKYTNWLYFACAHFSVLFLSLIQKASLVRKTEGR